MYVLFPLWFYFFVIFFIFYFCRTRSPKRVLQATENCRRYRHIGPEIKKEINQEKEENH
jgi:hypothetical protein